MAQQVVLGHGWTDEVSKKHSFSLFQKECLKTTKYVVQRVGFYVPNLYSFFTLITLAYNEKSLAVSKKNADKLLKNDILLISNFRHVLCCIISFRWFQSIWILCADISEHSVCSIFTGGVSLHHLWWYSFLQHS